MNAKHLPHFTIRIRLGNDTMQTRSHVAAALREIAKRVAQMPDDTPECRNILDANGNTVGDWTFVPNHPL